MVVEDPAMPLHDWSKVPSGLHHHFHQRWSTSICDALNRNLLPTNFEALIEQRSGPLESDVLTVDTNSSQIYAQRANRVAIKQKLGRTVAVIEIVSPGNKDSRAAFEDFVDNAIDFLRKGIHLLVIDPFPPGKRDPFGIHKAIWDMIEEEDFELPPEQNRIFASYVAGPEKVAYVEPVGVGQELPDMPVFITESTHVLVPLGPTYDEAWRLSPEPFRNAVETGILPTFDDDEA